jgi:hypothetical protein
MVNKGISAGIAGCYLSEQDYLEKKELQHTWFAFKSWIVGSMPPDNVTVKDIITAAQLLKLPYK